MYVMAGVACQQYQVSGTSYYIFVVLDGLSWQEQIQSFEIMFPQEVWTGCRKLSFFVLIIIHKLY